MSTERHAADRRRIATLVWLSMLLSGPLIFAVVFFVLKGAHFVDMASEYERWFLLGGIAAALPAVPLLRRFRAAAAQEVGKEEDAAYWERLNAAMFAGHAAADLPFFVGMAAFLAGGFIRTAVLLLALSVVLNSLLRPPHR